MTRLMCISLAFFSCGCFAATATADEEDVPVYLSAQDGGPDFLVQGEYVGKVNAEYGIEKWGAQVIALGNSKFRLVGYRGGLPGAGWERNDEKISVEGETEDGVTSFFADSWQAEIKDQTLTVSGPSGDDLGTLKKVNRQSPTLNAKPPADALVLFDGSSADQFDHGHLVEGKLLAAGCASKSKFSDHQLHIEFRTPFKPLGRGQGRGNSGVYVQSRYEVQVLDSFGLDGLNNECGGIYSISAPSVNMCFPPLSWQTYDIDFTAAKYEGDKKVKNARVTIRQNGVVIMDDIELPHGTPGRLDEGPDPAPLFLQGHGNPVVFRNIWVVKK
jgi:hypothetical protein